MTTITRERVAEIIHAAGLEPCDYEAVFGSIKTGEIVAMARIALASLEAEPVAWKWRLIDDAAGKSGPWRISFAPMKPGMGVGYRTEIIPLYTAPPAPVVPEEKCDDDGNTTSEFDHGWNACRAAMLQGADGNSPVIPDGLRLALSNAGIAVPESDEMLAATCEKHIQELVAWVKDRKPFRSAVIPDGWVMVPVDMTPEQMRAVQIKSELGSYAAANLSGAYALFREFWDVSVAAASKQEAE